MSHRLLSITSFAFLFFILLMPQVSAQSNGGDKHVEVSLRMIGHQILLQFGDSTSRVLPIIKVDGHYIIQFESDFEFNPGGLVATVNQVAKETKLAMDYIVEVEECVTGDIIYSFEMNNYLQQDIIPCGTRDQPKSCYKLLFTLLNSDVTPINSKEKEVNKSNSLSVWIVLVITALLFLISVFVFIRWKKKKTQSIDPNVINIGELQFDKRNTVLLFDQEKIDLTSKEADLLVLLYNSANRTIEREHILSVVWGDEGDYIGRTLDVFISKLRKKLEADSTIKIVNIRGVGYKLVMG